MAAIEKQINARLQLKYDSYANWQEKNPTLKSGEVAIAYLANSVDTTKPNPDNGTYPVLFKVGPGAFNSLPWSSALAADVHAWAKKSETEFTAWVKSLISPSEINAYTKNEVDTKLSNNSTTDQSYARSLIEGLDVTDNAVTGKYVSAVSETDGKITVTRADLPTHTLASGTANGTVAFDGNDVAVTGLKSAAYTDVQDYATSAQGIKADSAVQKVTVLGKELADNGSVSVAEAKTALGLKSAAYEEASAFDAAGSAAAVLGTTADEANAATVYGALKAAQDAQADIDAFFAAAATGDAALDTLKEIQDFLNSDEGTVQTLVDSVAGNKKAIEDIVDGTTTVKSAEKADVATKASGLDTAGEAAVKAVKVDNATNADQLDGVAAADYLKKTDAPGYGDILTKTNATTLYQPVGNYATATQGTKADSALQEIKTTENGGLKVTDKNQIDIDPDIVFIFNCGSATENIENDQVEE